MKRALILTAFLLVVSTSFGSGMFARRWKVANAGGGGNLTATEALAEIVSMGAEYAYWWNSTNNVTQYSAGLGEYIVTTLYDEAENGGNCTAGFLVNSPYLRADHIRYLSRAHDGFGENLMGDSSAQTIGISALIREDSGDTCIIGRGPANGGANSLKYGRSISISGSSVGVCAGNNSQAIWDDTAYDVGYSNNFTIVASCVGNGNTGTTAYFDDLTENTTTTADNSYPYAQANQAVGGVSGTDTASVDFYGAAFFTNELNATDSARLVLLLTALQQEE